MKWLTYSRRLPLRSLISGISPYLLTYARPGRVMQGSTSHGICSNARLLPLSSRPTSNNTILTLSLSVSWVAVVLEVLSLPVNKVLSKYRLAFFCESFGITSYFDARFRDDLAWWLFTRETSNAELAFMNIVDLWRARMPTYNDEHMICNHHQDMLLKADWGLLLVPKTCKF